MFHWHWRSAWQAVLSLSGSSNCFHKNSEVLFGVVNMDLWFCFSLLGFSFLAVLLQVSHFISSVVCVWMWSSPVSWCNTIKCSLSLVLVFTNYCRGRKGVDDKNIIRFVKLLRKATLETLPKKDTRVAVINSQVSQWRLGSIMTVILNQPANISIQSR